MFSVRTVVKEQGKVLTTQWQDEEDTEIEPVMMMNVCLPALTETRKLPADPKSRLRYQPRAHSICPAQATPPPRTTRSPDSSVLTAGLLKTILLIHFRLECLR